MIYFEVMAALNDIYPDWISISDLIRLCKSRKPNRRFGPEKTNVSRILRSMRNHGKVECKIEGTKKLYRATREMLSEDAG